MQTSNLKNNFDNKMSDTPSWLTPKLINTVSHTFGTSLEIPRRLAEAAPNLFHLDNQYDHRIMSDVSKILSSEMSLLQQEIELIQKRLDGFDKFNLFDLCVTNGLSTLPFVLELFQEQEVNKYVPVTWNRKMNQHAINKLKAFCLMSNLPVFSSDSIDVEPEIRSFRDEVLEVQGQKDDRTANLFLIMSSNLGNYIDPQKVLRNVYQSMGANDYLVIIQGVYRSGIEDMLVNDYHTIWNFMKDTHDICRVINPESQFNIFWDDTNEENRGIKITFNIDKPTTFAGKELASGDVVTAFRSRRFHRHDLENTLNSVGFRTVEIAYDKNMDSALFFVVK